MTMQPASTEIAIAHGGDHRGSEGAGRPAAADPARHPGRIRLCAAGIAAGHRRGAEHLQGRSARRRHLLSRLPRPSGRPACAEALPGRSLPVDGLGRDRGAGQAAARHRLPRDGQGRLGDAGAGLLPRAVRLRALGHARRRGDRPARRRQARRDRRGGAAHDRRPSTSPAIPARWRSAPTRSPRRSRRKSRRAASTRRSCATARAAPISWSRWSRSRPTRAASPTGR